MAPTTVEQVNRAWQNVMVLCTVVECATVPIFRYLGATATVPTIRVVHLPANGRKDAVDIPLVLRVTFGVVFPVGPTGSRRNVAISKFAPAILAMLAVYTEYLTTAVSRSAHAVSGPNLRQHFSCRCAVGTRWIHATLWVALGSALHNVPLWRRGAFHTYKYHIQDCKTHWTEDG